MQGKVVVTCMNPLAVPLRNKAGTVIGVDDKDIDIQVSNQIQQPPHRHRVEKEAEAKRQVKLMLARNLIQPGEGAWSAPVVLVRKDD